MTPEQAAAFVNSQVACALIELEGMKSLNTYRQMRGETIAYNEDAFLELLERYPIQHNDVVGKFIEVNNS